MTRPLRFSYPQEGDIARLPGVRRAIAEVADRVAAEARRVAADAGMPHLPITREDGTRPRGRPYARISAPLAPEYGTSSQSRLAILGLALARARR